MGTLFTIVMTKGGSQPVPRVLMAAKLGHFRVESRRYDLRSVAHIVGAEVKYSQARALLKFL